MNISSLIVDVQPMHAGAVHQALSGWAGVEVHARTDQGKLIVTLETDSEAGTTETFSRIGALQGVMSVALVYHQFDPEPETEPSHGTDAT